MRHAGTILDAVGRAKHTVGDGAATVTVHGECPVSGCREMNVVSVSAATSTITCAGCGAAFDV